MDLRLTPEQVTYLRTVAPEYGTRILPALRLKNANRKALAEAVDVKPQQLTGWLSGKDLLLSAAYRVADAFGVEVSDIWPESPKANRRKAAPKKKAARAVRRGPRAEAA